MTGYQEAVTDPSYAGQIITFTYPMIGNYGVSAEAMESGRAHARGVIMREARNNDRRGDRRWRLARLARVQRRLGDHRSEHPGPGPSHPRPGSDARRDLPGRRLQPKKPPEGSKRNRRWPAPTSLRRSRPKRRSSMTATGRMWSPSTPESSRSIVNQFLERDCRVTLLPCLTASRGSDGPGAGPALSGERPGGSGRGFRGHRHGS